MERTTSSLKLDYASVKEGTMILRSINHKLRQHIIKMLEESQRMNVTDIYVKLRLEQSVASQHLAILRRANIVSTEREGKSIYYSLNVEGIDKISRLVNKLVHTEEPANN